MWYNVVQLLGNRRRLFDTVWPIGFDFKSDTSYRAILLISLILSISDSELSNHKYKRLSKQALHLFHSQFTRLDWLLFHFLRRGLLIKISTVVASPLDPSLHVHGFTVASAAMTMGVSKEKNLRSSSWGLSSKKPPLGAYYYSFCWLLSPTEWLNVWLLGSSLALSYRIPWIQGWIHFISATRWLPQSLHLHIGQRFPPGFRTWPSSPLGKTSKASRKTMTSSSWVVWRETSNIDMDLSWKIWQHQMHHWHSLPSLEVGPISNQFIQCAFPLPLLEAKKGGKRVQGLWDVPSNLAGRGEPFATWTWPIHLLPEDLHREWCMLLKQLQILVMLVPEIRGQLQTAGAWRVWPLFAMDFGDSGTTR